MAMECAVERRILPANPVPALKWKARPLFQIYATCLEGGEDTLRQCVQAALGH